MNESICEIIVTNEALPRYRFLLFVAQEGLNSRLAKENLERICEQHLAGRHEIEIVDVVEDYQRALEYHVLLTPALILLSPEPRITILGNLKDMAKVLACLRLDREAGHGK